jgi:hypothetical protein
MLWPFSNIVEKSRIANAGLRAGVASASPLPAALDCRRDGRLALGDGLQCFGIVNLRRLLSGAGSIRARARPNRDHRCTVNLRLLDRAAGVSGGIATLPSLGELKYDYCFSDTN